MQIIYLDAVDTVIIGKILNKEDEVLVCCDASIAGFTINLPWVNEMRGRKIIFKKTDSTTNAVVLTAATGQSIDASSTYTLDEAYQCIQLFADKNQYWNLNPTASQTGAPDAVVPSVAGNFVTFADTVGTFKDSGISAESGVF